MHAHRVDVLDGADDDAIVALVAHDLHLELFPAEHAFLDQHLAGRRGVDAALDDLDELGLVVGDAAAGAAEREGRPDDRRQADVVERGQRRPTASSRDASAASSRPIFVIASRNRSRSSALSIASAVAPIISTSYSSSTPIFLSDSAQFSAVWPPIVGSSAKPPGTAWRSAAMILATTSGRDRLDIGAVGHVRIGHDRRRIGIDEDDPVALVAQRLAGLRAGIIEFAGLPDDDRPGADDQDGRDVGAFGHGRRDSVPLAHAGERGREASARQGPQRWALKPSDYRQMAGL